MKKRLHDKKVGIAILLSLLIISLMEVVLRGVLLKKAMADVSNAGEPIINALLSLILIIFAVKGKDRLFYICTGGFLACFVLNQLFGLPGLIANFVSIQANGMSIPIGNVGILIQIFSMICIIVIGVLLVEYMNDGTIHNKAFNILCVATLLSQLIYMIIGVILVASGNSFDKIYILAVLNGLSNMTMVFLFTFFAYYSAKHQLKKTDFTK